jgi:hypothetical protein
MKFVLIHHQSPMGNHWDVMLESDSALMTWSIPPQCPSGTSFVCSAIQLPEHRKHYLDYEGEITGNRGVVSRVDAGTYEQMSPETFVLRGKHFTGKLTLNNGTMAFESYRMPAESDGYTESGDGCGMETISELDEKKRR